jgi:hypothetical protein
MLGHAGWPLLRLPEVEVKTEQVMVLVRGRGIVSFAGSKGQHEGSLLRFDHSLLDAAGAKPHWPSSRFM